MAITFPPDCNTNAERRVYVRRVWRALIIGHNLLQEKFANGEFSEKQFNRYQAMLRARQELIAPFMGMIHPAAATDEAQETYRLRREADFADNRWTPRPGDII